MINGTERKFYIANVHKMYNPEKIINIFFALAKWQNCELTLSDFKNRF